MQASQIAALATILLAGVATAAVAAPGQALSPSLCIDGEVKTVTAQEALEQYGMAGAVNLDDFPTISSEDPVQVCAKGWAPAQVRERANLCPPNCYKNCGKLIWPWAIFG